MSSLIVQLQEDAAGRLSADPYAVDLPVLLVRTGVTDNEVKRALDTRTVKGGKSGAALLVLMPERKVASANAPGPQYDHVLTIRTLTLPKLNDAAGGTKKSAEEIAVWVERLLHHFGIGPTTLNFIEAQPYVGDDGDVGYDSSFGIMQGMKAPRKARKPAFSLDDLGGLAITTGTGGAAIRYTTDGSYPGTAATAYTVPVNPPAGAVVRAVAYAPGYQASDVAELDTSLSS